MPSVVPAKRDIQAANAVTPHHVPEADWPLAPSSCTTSSVPVECDFHPDYSYEDYIRSGGYMANDVSGKLSRDAFEDVKAKCQPFNGDGFVDAINAAEVSRNRFHSAPATDSVTDTTGPLHAPLAAADCTYDVYIALGGYLPGGGGGKLSRRRFEQIKADIHPFDVDSFVDLVISLEGAQVNFDHFLGPTTPFQTDSQRATNSAFRHRNSMSNPRTPDHRHSASNRGTAALVMTPFASSQLLRSLQTRQNAFEGLYGRTTSESESRFARLEARINDLEASENRLERLEARIRDLQVQVADLLSSYKDA